MTPHDLRLDADLGMDFIDKIDLSMYMENRFRFNEKDAVWGDFLHEQNC